MENAEDTVLQDQPAPENVADDLVADELVEDVSIDGMCGVY